MCLKSLDDDDDGQCFVEFLDDQQHIHLNRVTCMNTCIQYNISDKCTLSGKNRLANCQ